MTHQIINPNQSTEKEEQYYYYLLKLFKPWRDERDIILPGLSYRETFAAECQTFPDMLSYHQQTMNTAAQDEKVEQEVRKRGEELDAEELDEDGIEDNQTAFAGCAIDHAQSAMEDLKAAHAHTLRTDDSSIDPQHTYDTLNTDQKRIVDHVLQKVCLDQSVVRLIISGQGGTGKSRVIDVLNRLICQKFKHVELPFVVAAPTGLSAFNVNGTTVHRTLCLPVEHGKPADYCRLNQDQLSVLRRTLKGLKLLIVDEVSMISSITLLYMHLRLTEIMANNDYFGGISVVFFADFLQLPPVKGNQPFVPVSFFEAKQRLGAIASVDLVERILVRRTHHQHEAKW